MCKGPEACPRKGQQAEVGKWGLEARGPVEVAGTQTPSPRALEGTMASVLRFVGRTQVAEGTL